MAARFEPESVKTRYRRCSAKYTVERVSSARSFGPAASGRRTASLVRRAHCRHRSARRLSGRGRRPQPRWQTGPHRSRQRHERTVWYENPGWQRHILATGQSRMINCVVIGNEIVLASEFSNEARNSIGLVSVLRPGSDPVKPWTATEIDRLPTSHRLRVADLFGDGNPSM